jgi:hypothetical protein
MDSIVAARPFCGFDQTSVGPMTGASAEQAEVLVDPTLPFLLG